MITVTLLFPNGRTKDVALYGVPRTGDRIDLDDGPGQPSLVVEQVTWTEGANDPPDPQVVVSVRPRPE